MMSHENPSDERNTVSFRQFYYASGQREFVPLAQRVRSLYIKAWLVEQERFDDAQDYNKTGDPKYEQECGLRLKYGPLNTSVSPPIQEVTLDIPSTHNPILMRVVQVAMLEDLR